MAKKREIFKVDEDALKDMMASESISCGKSGADVGENVLPVTEKEKNVSEVKTQGQEKSRKTIRADPGLEEKVEVYKNLFLDRKKSVHRKQTYISYDMYCRLARILPLLSDDMSVPAFLDNVLAHHLETYAAKPQKHSENDVDFIDCCRIGMRHSAVLCLCAVQKDLLTERTGQGVERENRNSESLSRILPCLSERCSRRERSADTYPWLSV